MPGLAGASRMPHRRFLTYNAAGALVWGVGFTLLGYFAGHSYAAVERALGRGSAILVVILIAGSLLLWWRRHQVDAAPPDDGADT